MTEAPRISSRELVHTVVKNDARQPCIEDPAIGEWGSARILPDTIHDAVRIDAFPQLARVPQFRD